MTFEFEDKQEIHSPQFRRLAKSVEDLTAEVNELVCWKSRAQGMLIVVRWLVYLSLAYVVGSCINRVTYEYAKASRPVVAQEPAARK